jgi:hypothetical protein
MTREEISRMAREANRYASHQTNDSYEWQEIRDERFAALVAAHIRETEFKPDWNNYNQGRKDGAEEEREACAKVCEDKATYCETKAQEAMENGEHDEVSAIRSTAWQISVCAAAIRAREQA